jgi:hypothetical protein
MLKYLKLQNVGPAAEMELELGSRLNILTGDNGLGKSFLLDVAWFVATRCWPYELNPKISSGRVAEPTANKIGQIHAIWNRLSKDHLVKLDFDKWERSWDRADWGFPHDRLTFYFMADGSCAVVDALRNRLWEEPSPRLRQRLPAFVFDRHQIWNGLEQGEGEHRISHCNGLIRDWAYWQLRGGEAFEALKKLLEKLSPSDSEAMQPGALTRVGREDVRDIPSIRMPFGDETPILYASAAIRRILSIAYIIIWAWEEHKKAALASDTKKTANKFLILFDEVEAHLHPAWQRKILPSLLEITKILSPDIELQLIATTHSPLIMASLEPIFDPEIDAWFDLDLVGENGHREVKLEKREFEILGNADDWLTSEAFDLESTGSLAAEALMKEVEEAMDSTSFDYAQAKLLHEKLVRVLPADDTFFIRWRMIGKQKGWWK